VRLSAKPVINYQNNNSFDYASEWNIRQGESNTLYFQLVDLDQAGLRYMPQSGTSVSVIFPSLNTNNTLTITAIQASADDKSIWKVDLTANQIPSTGNVNFTIVESGNTKRFSLLQGIVVESLNQGGC
jgi:hypothetical protein